MAEVQRKGGIDLKDRGESVVVDLDNLERHGATCSNPGDLLAARGGVLATQVVVAARTDVSSA
jgi:hypothetical protein